jgi:iron(III) transport system substrate-binding protein
MPVHVRRRGRSHQQLTRNRGNEEVTLPAHRNRFVHALVASLLLPLLLAGCAPAESPEQETLTVYSGRNERLIGPMLERFGEQTGIDVQVRYGSTSELAATLLEEGPHTPADLFISQDAAALGALSRAGMLTAVPGEFLDSIAPAYRSAHGDWVGLSGRARVIVYNTDLIAPDALPQTLEQVTDPRFRGKFGVAPTNASFQAHMAMYGAVNGEEGLDDLLRQLAANEPRRYPKNSPIVEAVIAGEIEWGLVNHYYLWRALEESPEAPAKNFFMKEGAGSHFVNVAGAGLLKDTPAARRLLGFLLHDEAQRYFAEETYEYPLLPGVAAPEGLPPLDELPGQQIDYQQVAATLDRALEQIRESGLLQFE